MKKPMFFLMPEGDAAGGATAVAEKPAGDAASDLINFTPAPIADLDSIMDDGKAAGAPAAPAAPAAKPAEEKPVEQAPVKKEEPAKPDEKKGGIENLRAAHEAQKKTLAEREKLLAERDTELAELRKKLEEAGKEDPRIADLSGKLTAREKRAADLESQLALHDPAVTSELDAMVKTYNESAEKTFAYVPELREKFRGLVQRMNGIRPGTEGYAQALREFKGELQNDFGSDSPLVFQTLVDAQRFQSQYAAKSAEVRANAGKARTAARTREFETGSAALKVDLKEALEIPEDIVASDPYHPVLMLKRLEEAAGTEQAGKISRGVDGLIERAIVGFKPKTEADFVGMTPEQISEALAKEGQERTAAVKMLARQAKIGLSLVPYLRQFFGEYMKMDERIKKSAEGLPPDPTDAARAAGEHKPEEKGIEEYEAPPIPSMKSIM